MSRKSKNHKRGERGSTDKELKIKMGQCGVTAEKGASKETTEISEELNRCELRKLLVDIQITVNNIS